MCIIYRLNLVVETNVDQVKFFYINSIIMNYNQLIYTLKLNVFQKFQLYSTNVNV